MKLSSYLRQFLEHLEIERGRSQMTIRNYEFYLSRFFEWAKDPDAKDVTSEIIRQYRLFLNRKEDGRGGTLKKTTQNYHLIALRTFLKYLAKIDVKTLAAEKIELAKQGSRDVSFLDGSDLSRLLEAPEHTDSPEIIKLRDRAILELFFSTGMRVSELASLKTDQVNLDRDEFTVRGKGDKTRVVFLSNQAKHAIRSYLEKRNDDASFLFVRHDRAVGASRSAEKDKDDSGIGAITPRSIERLVQRYAVMSGIPKHVTPHTLRHSFATDLLMNGADIRSVQSMLGHSSITTTQIYTHITNQQLREVHKAFHGKTIE